MENENTRIDNIFKVMSIVTIVFCFLVLNLVYLYQGLNSWYRYQYRSNNELYWQKINNNQELNEGEKEWRVKNNDLHFALNKNPINLDLSVLAFFLIAITSSICGIELTITNIRNLELPKGESVNIPKNKKRLILFLNILWIITMINFLFIWIRLGTEDIYTNTKIPFPNELIQAGMGFTTFVTVLGNTGKGITKVLPQMIGNKENKEDKKE